MEAKQGALQGLGEGPAGTGTAVTGILPTATGTNNITALSESGTSLNSPKQTGASDYTVDRYAIPCVVNTGDSRGLHTVTPLAGARVTAGNWDRSLLSQDFWPTGFRTGSVLPLLLRQYIADRATLDI